MEDKILLEQELGCCLARPQNRTAIFKRLAGSHTDNIKGKFMLRSKATRCLLVLFLALWCSSGWAYTSGNERKGTPGQQAFAMTADALIARPVQLVLTSAGTLLFTTALPITALTGSIDEAAEILVRYPARNTFLRCLGCVTVSP
jgi:hypothetical protein